MAFPIPETFNGLMVIPNLIGVLLLSGTVFRLVKKYFEENETISHGIIEK